MREVLYDTEQVGCVRRAGCHGHVEKPPERGQVLYGISVRSRVAVIAESSRLESCLRLQMRYIGVLMQRPDLDSMSMSRADPIMLTHCLLYCTLPFE